MRYRNIYTIDDFLIFIGIAMMFTVSIVGISQIAAGLKNGHAVPLFVGFLLIVGPISMLASGLIIRRKEKKVNKLINVLEMSPDCGIPDLVNNTRLTPEQIKTSLVRIADLGIAYYEWDEKLCRVYDRRLLDQFVFVHSCPSCGGSVGRKYSLILPRVPSCDYCGKPYEIKFWNELRFGVMNSIVKNNLELYKLDLQKQTKDINIPLAIILFVCFWPAGVWYLISRRKTSKG